jgi:pSer/pThr/pTyr-binding forkhead associated (FHA) protein
VSGTHFEVSARDDGYRLRDLSSRNGIFVGDLRIREVFLRPGTVFRIGHTSVPDRPHHHPATAQRHGPAPHSGAHLNQ